jgi:hypothetical protein
VGILVVISSACIWHVEMKVSLLKCVVGAAFSPLLDLPNSNEPSRSS